MDDSPAPTDSPSSRRFSGLPAFFVNAAGAIARTAAAAGSLVTDGDLRKRGGEVIATGASKGLRGIQQGLQTGASTIQRGLYTVGQGPRQIQSVLQRLSHEIEEQRMKILLAEQRDAPVDVQIGFQIYEDAPQELRSRLWMALLQHPELVQRYQAIQKTEEQEESEIGSSSSSVPPQDEAEADPPKDLAEDENRNKEEKQQHHSPSPTKEEKQEEKEEIDWEVVGDRGARRWRQGRRLLAGSSLHRSEPWNSAKESLRQDLMAAMASVAWPLDTEIDPESRYSTLLQISIGQEEVDDVIQRDVHRTFPEYPYFDFKQGQQALFRVLKAYSLHDLETGYCQGMAFVAGLVLFFVPEEPAFQIFCRLLAETGPNLRRYYLPGLSGLKIELKMFEILLERHLQLLKSHLEAQGAVPVLYAAQWFLSAFSCPFPVGFACRLVDVMLIENSDAVLLKVALAVMAECEAELMMQEDFEELLTYLKVEPVQWGTHRLRRVLNAAIHDSPITTAELVEVRRLAEEEEAAMLAKEEEARRKSPVKKKRPEQLLSDEIVDYENDEEIQQQSEDDQLAAELAQHQAEMDNDYVQMVLDFEQHLWGSGGGDGDAFGEEIIEGENTLKNSRTALGAAAEEEAIEENSA